jgi:hypothetical protein
MGKRRKHRAASPRETPKTATETPSLIVPTHGHGALLSGGMPGNKGGTGRPASEVRARCLGSFAERIAVLEEIADSRDSSPSDRRAAVDTLGKYAGLQKVEHTGADDTPLRFTLDLGTSLSDEQAE